MLLNIDVSLGSDWEENAPRSQLEIGEKRILKEAEAPATHTRKDSPPPQPSIFIFIFNANCFSEEFSLKASSEGRSIIFFVKRLNGGSSGDYLNTVICSPQDSLSDSLCQRARERGEGVSQGNWVRKERTSPCFWH